MENETSDVQPKCQGPLQLLSPPFLMTSTTKQRQPNGRGLKHLCFKLQNYPFAMYSNETVVAMQTVFTKKLIYQLKIIIHIYYIGCRASIVQFLAC